MIKDSRGSHCVRDRRKDILLLILFALLLRGLWFSATMERDEGEFAYTAWLISSNQTSHLTLQDYNVPTIHRVYAALITLFGNTLLPMKLLNHFLFLLSVPFFYKLTERTLGRKNAIAGAVLYVISMNIPAFEGPLAKTTSFASPIVVIGIYFLVQSHFSSRIPNLAISALCMTIAFLFRPTMGFGFLLIATDITILLKSKMVSLRTRMWFFAGITSFLSLVAIGVSVLILFHARWQGNLMMTMEKILMNLSFFLWPIFHFWYPQPVGMFILEGLFLFPLLAAGLLHLTHIISGSKEHEIMTLYKVFLLWFFLSFMVTILPPMFGYYYLHMLPPLSIIAGVGFIRLANWISQKKRVAKITIISVFSILILISFYYQSLHFPNFNSVALKKRWDGWTYSDVESFQNQKDIAEFISEHTTSNQTVIIWGQAFGILFLSERHAPKLRISPLTCAHPTQWGLPAPGVSLEETQLFLDNLAFGEPLKLDIPTVEFSRHNLERLVSNDDPDAVGALVMFPNYLQFCNHFDKPMFSEMVQNWSSAQIGGATIYIKNSEG